MILVKLYRNEISFLDALSSEKAVIIISYPLEKNILPPQKKKFTTNIL